MEYEYGQEMPEIQDFLHRHRMTSHGRRKTVHVAERGQTALGLLRLPPSPGRKTFMTKRASLTPSPAVKITFNFERSRLDRPVSCKVRVIHPPTSPRLFKPRSEQSHLHHGGLDKKHVLYAPFYQRRGSIMRRRSTVTSDNTDEEEYRKKRLLAKFRLAGKLAIFCSRNFKQHCLRLNEHQDELAPYIKRLHFHEDDNTDDLLIDLSKFKANRQMRIPEETKRILSKEFSHRTEQEVYHVTLALRNIKSFSEYPKRMQEKIAEVGLYEKYESKRMIVRQGHPASAFYFILSGAVVVMVMDEDSKYARPVAHLYKGQTFGELAIINESKRNSTVIAKETCEFMSISAKDYHKIFMAGGVKNINDPDQEIFLKSLTCLAAWPIHILQENPNKCQFLFFKNGEVIVRDSHYSDWVIIVKSGSVQVLKKLKRVEAFEWKRKKAIEYMSGSKKREVVNQRTEWRRVLPELGIPLSQSEEEDNNIEFYENGKPVPFVHPEGKEKNLQEDEEHTKKQPQIPNLWPFKVDISEIESGRYIEDNRHAGPPFRTISGTAIDTLDSKYQGRKLNRLTVNNKLGKQRDRSHSMAHEEEKELLGYQPHIRTIMEDIDSGMKRKDSDVEINPADINPEFVHVQTLTKGQVYGLADVILKDQPSFSVVSHGADCLLINKQFYLEHASEKLLRDMRQELCPYPTEEELQESLQVSVDWQAFKKTLLIQSMEKVSSRKSMRTTLNGTKTQEAFVY
ncbi:uncharacterized protein LOC132717657 isoform X2 [Ruditapes philippinarum]|uniref:uncharacterized protein LOC132717657 isoform X2 n=1 Tax=Ruditapes philippinarum TaxID=129788 RepID=UPI00295B343B|nr:uncharacterized protein LOC132717657 isoform X2 [Ruditapes philippinarum]